jgi:hypothetical protein
MSRLRQSMCLCRVCDRACVYVVSATEHVSMSRLRQSMCLCRVCDRACVYVASATEHESMSRLRQSMCLCRVCDRACVYVASATEHVSMSRLRQSMCLCRVCATVSVSGRDSRAGHAHTAMHSETCTRAHSRGHWQCTASMRLTARDPTGLGGGGCDVVWMRGCDVIQTDSGCDVVWIRVANTRDAV